MSNEVERDAPADVVSDARLAVDELISLLNAVGADRSTATPEMFVHVIPGDDASLRRLVDRHRGDEPWVYFMVGEGKGIAFPINPRQQARSATRTTPARRGSSDARPSFRELARRPRAT